MNEEVKAPEPPPHSPKPALFGLTQKALLVAVGALVVGGLAGAGIAVGTLLPQLTEAQSDLASTERSLVRTEQERDSSIARHGEAVDLLNEKIAALADSEAKLKEREAAVQQREDAITATEAAIEASSFGAGVKVVGRDVAAGEYRTEGVSGCYYAWMTGTGSDAGIIDNNIVSGSATVTLHDGDIFESSRCGTWTKIG